MLNFKELFTKNERNNANKKDVELSTIQRERKREKQEQEK